MRVVPLADRGLVRLITATYHKPPTLRGLVDTGEAPATRARGTGAPT